MKHRYLRLALCAALACKNYSRPSAHVPRPMPPRPPAQARIFFEDPSLQKRFTELAEQLNRQPLAVQGYHEYPSAERLLRADSTGLRLCWESAVNPVSCADTPWPSAPLSIGVADQTLKETFHDLVHDTRILTYFEPPYRRQPISPDAHELPTIDVSDEILRSKVIEFVALLNGHEEDIWFAPGKELKTRVRVDEVRDSSAKLSLYWWFFREGIGVFGHGKSDYSLPLRAFKVEGDWFEPRFCKDRQIQVGAHDWELAFPSTLQVSGITLLQPSIVETTQETCGKAFERNRRDVTALVFPLVDGVIRYDLIKLLREISTITAFDSPVK